MTEEEIIVYMENFIVEKYYLSAELLTKITVTSFETYFFTAPYPLHLFEINIR